MQLVGVTKDENIGIDENIEGQKYGNIGGNIDIDKTLKEMVEIYKKIWKFLMKL